MDHSYIYTLKLYKNSSYTITPILAILYTYKFNIYSEEGKLYLKQNIGR